MFQFSILTQPSTSAVARLENGEERNGEREKGKGQNEEDAAPSALINSIRFSTHALTGVAN